MRLLLFSFAVAVRKSLSGHQGGQDKSQENGYLKKKKIYQDGGDTVYFIKQKADLHSHVTVRPLE